VAPVSLRPSVFASPPVSGGAAGRHLAPRRTALFAACVWPVALLAELSSTRTGVPFGLYHYTGNTRHRELFVADVPFMDSLSFVFLAYASLCLARRVRAGLPSTSEAGGRPPPPAGLPRPPPLLPGRRRRPGARP